MYGAANTSGSIDITIDGALDCPAEDHPNFSSFSSSSVFRLSPYSHPLNTLTDADLTTLPEADFLLVGNSYAVANMSIGQIMLNPIKVNVSTSLLGNVGDRER